MRLRLLVVAISGLALTPVAGSASDRYVLWSARTAGAPSVPAHVLPADLDSVPQGSAIVVDRTVGGRLAVATRDQVVLENLDGSGRVVLPVAGVYDGRFSPDGSQLALASTACETGELVCLKLSIVDSDGGDLRTFPKPAGTARWFDNRTLAYVRNVGTDGIGTLVVGDANGRVLRVLGRSLAQPYVGPATSPNRKLVADQCRAQLVCVRSTGVPSNVVARFPGALTAPSLWSPDGSRIALTLAGNYTSRTVVGIVRTSRLKVISSPLYIHMEDTIIGWSPDSTTVLIQRRCFGADFCKDDVFSDVVSTHARRRLTHDDLKWESVRWARASLTYVTPPDE
jgi:hypothetical protein